MIITPKMFVLQEEIKRLEEVSKRDPGDYLSAFELAEARISLDKLGRIEKLGLKLILGGKYVKQASTNSTKIERQNA